MDSRLKEIFSGQTSKTISIFWFTLLSYIATIVALEVIHNKIDSSAVFITAKLSYFFIFLWLKSSVNHAIWWAFPSYNPEYLNTQKNGIKRAEWGGRVSALIICGIYYFVTHVVSKIIESNTPIQALGAT
ncbi:MAG: hypothetical protein KUG82_01685 [Pseudomonadales bacterium]|nr:hypothetical protein [Pseudomonadales bacterium]